MMVDDPRWTAAEILCFSCTLEAFEYTQSALQEAQNTGRPLSELQKDVRELNRSQVQRLLTESAIAKLNAFDPMSDPVFKCEPVGLFRTVDGILPVRIEQTDDQVVIRYEYWNAVRTIPLIDVNAPYEVPETTSRLGSSVGWFDGPTLVVFTQRIDPHLAFFAIMPGVEISQFAIATERYTVTPDGERIVLEWTMVDPLTLKLPMTYRMVWLRDPSDAKLEPFECDPHDP